MNPQPQGAAPALDTSLAWAEAQFGGPRCEVPSIIGEPGGERVPCELPATWTLVIEHKGKPGDPDNTSENLACDYHAEKVQEIADQADGVLGHCPFCRGPLVLAAVVPL